MHRSIAAAIALAFAASICGAANLSLLPERLVSEGFVSSAVHPQIARTGGHFIAVWIDERSSNLWAMVDDQLIELDANGAVTAPSVGAGGQSFLVTWFDTSRNSRLATIVDFDGTRTPLTPFILASGAVGADAEPASIAFDGTEYIVVWTTDGFHQVRLSKAGVSQNFVTDPAFPRRSAHQPKLIQTPSGLKVAYAIENTCDPSATNCDVSWSAGLMALDRINSFTWPAVLFDIAGTVRTFDAVATKDSIVWAWSGTESSQELITLRTTSFDGEFFGPPARALEVCAGTEVFGPRLAWNGLDLIVAWTGGNGCGAGSSSYSVRVARFDANLHAIDNDDIEISPGAEPEAPSLAATINDVTIAYSKLDLVTGKIAIFARTLGRSVPLATVHRRSVSP